MDHQCLELQQDPHATEQEGSLVCAQGILRAKLWKAVISAQMPAALTQKTIHTWPKMYYDSTTVHYARNYKLNNFIKKARCHILKVFPNVSMTRMFSPPHIKKSSITLKHPQIQIILTHPSLLLTLPSLCSWNSGHTSAKSLSLTIPNPNTLVILHGLQSWTSLLPQNRFSRRELVTVPEPKGIHVILSYL